MSATRRAGAAPRSPRISRISASRRAHQAARSSACAMAARARRCCSCTAIRKTTPAGTRSRRGSRRHYHVILPDLRGYGDSSLPEPGPDHINFSFRAMSQDLLEIMEQLGYRELFRRRPRPRRAHDAPHVHRSSRARDQGVPDGHRAEPITCGRTPRRTGRSAPGTGASWRSPSRFPERLISAVPAEYLPEEPHGDPRRHGPGLSHRFGARRVRALLHAEDDHRLVPRLSRAPPPATS